MLYQLGRVLKFNKSEWGFIDYSKGKLTVFSIKEKRKVVFNVKEDMFKNIYSNSSYNEISQETIDFAIKEEKQEEDIKNSLKRGIKFIGSDNEEYTFLNLNNNKITFYNNEDTFTAKINFVKEVKNEFDENYINHIEYVKTKKEYNKLTTKEKVMCAINYCKECYKDAELEILELGNIVSGTAYYHEVDKNYNLIGLEIKVKYKFDFEEDFSTQIGFFPIYVGRIPDYYPISFEESYGEMNFNETMYSNGLGDEIEIYEILIEKSVIDKIDF